jgi:hypothetical protein
VLCARPLASRSSTRACTVARVIDRGYVTRAARVVASNPLEGLDRLRNRVERIRQPGPHSYVPTPDWEQHLHELLGVPWPCDAADEFSQLWSGLQTRLRVDALPLGQFHDADPALARAVWCLTNHLKPQVVVETGVARGITTSFILRGLKRNGHGHLWSIDLPPLQHHWREQAAEAVTADVRAHWTLFYGSSRRRLRPLLRELRLIDMFVHDSLHTERNMHFEFSAAWRALRPGGVLIADDVQRNAALARFLGETRSAWSIVASDKDKVGSFFAVIYKDDPDSPAGAGEFAAR